MHENLLYSKKISTRQKKSFITQKNIIFYLPVFQAHKNIFQKHAKEHGTLYCIIPSFRYIFAVHISMYQMVEF